MKIDMTKVYWTRERFGKNIPANVDDILQEVNEALDSISDKGIAAVEITSLRLWDYFREYGEAYGVVALYDQRLVDAVPIVADMLDLSDYEVAKKFSQMDLDDFDPAVPLDMEELAQVVQGGVPPYCTMIPGDDDSVDFHNTLSEAVEAARDITRNCSSVVRVVDAAHGSGVAFDLDFQHGHPFILSYTYHDLRILATRPEATQDDINSLGLWFRQYGAGYWNGEFYDMDEGLRLFPVDDHFEIR